MSYFYFQVLKKIKNNINPIELLAEQFLYNFVFYGIIYIVWGYFKQPLTDQKSFNAFLIMLVVLILTARSLYLIIRNKIFSISPIIISSFPKKERNKLIWEIEKSLKNSTDFSKWSCGILATLLVLIISIASNASLSILSKIGTKQEIIDLINSSSPFTNNLFLILLENLIVLILIILAYYLALQVPTYNKRLVLRVLRNCSYKVNSSPIDQPKFEKIVSFIEELVFWDTIKHIFNDYTKR
ncbi:hypothetical protein ACVRWF_04765 [Streptococcus uberis]